MKNLRYALKCDPDWRDQRVHRAEGDESLVTLCGQQVGTAFRYSRRAVAALSKKADCRSCEKVRLVRSRR